MGRRSALTVAAADLPVSAVRRCTCSCAAGWVSSCSRVSSRSAARSDRLRRVALPVRGASGRGDHGVSAGSRRTSTETGTAASPATAALLPSGVTVTRGRARSRGRRSGCRSLVDGVLPAGVLSLAEAPAVPVLGLDAPTSRGRSGRRSVAGAPVTASIGAPRVSTSNPQAADVAPFSSRGLAYDGGAKPDLAAAGVGIATSEPGRGEAGVARYGSISGSSAAAARRRWNGGGARPGAARPRRRRSPWGARRRCSAAGRGAGRRRDGARRCRCCEPPRSSLPTLRPIGLPGRHAKRGRRSRPDPAKRLAPATRRSARRRATHRGAGRGRSGSADVGSALQPGGRGAVGVSVSCRRSPPRPPAVRGLLIARGRGRRPPPDPVGGRGRGTRRAAARLRRTPLSRARRPTDRSSPWVLRFVAGRVDGTEERPQLSAVSLLELAAVPRRAARRHAQPAPRRAAGAVPRSASRVVGRAAGGSRPGPTSCASSVTRPASASRPIATVPFSIP